MLTTSTPEVVNPVSDACEAAGVPCISTVVPWEAWYFGRGAKPGKPSPFRFTYHFCFGVPNFFDTYTHLWPQVPTNKVVGVMWPNDADGNAIRGALGPLLEKAGYKIVDPGAYQDGTTDYTRQITKFKQAGDPDLQHVPDPARLRDLLAPGGPAGADEADQDRADCENGTVRLAGLGARLARLQPRERRLLGRRPGPYSSPLTGITNKALAAGYTKQTGKQWNQQMGAEPRALRRRRRRAEGERQPEGQDGGRERDEDAEGHDAGRGISHWGKGPRCRTSSRRRSPAASGSRRRAGKFKLEWVFCEHSDDHNVPIQAKLKPYNS